MPCARRTFISRALSAFLSGVAACSTPTGVPDAGLREGARLELTGPAVFQMIDRRTGRLLSSESLTWRSTGVVRNGVAIAGREEHPERPVLRTGDTYDIPDTIVAQVLPMLGFTSSGANPAYLTSGQSGADTVVTTAEDGQTLVTVVVRGDLGQPLTMRVTKGGVLVLSARYTWVAVQGGIQASLAIYEDWSDPEVLLRTRVDVTSARVVTLTILEEATRSFQEVATRAGSACLPQQLYAQGAGCTAAKASLVVTVSKWLWSNVKLLLLKTPVAAVDYFMDVGAMAASIIATVAACKT